LLRRHYGLGAAFAEVLRPKVLFCQLHEHRMLNSSASYHYPLTRVRSFPKGMQDGFFIPKKKKKKKKK
jgi:hypothetical protein